MFWLQRSTIDHQWLEIHSQTGIVAEVKVPFCIRRFPKSFDSLDTVHSWLKDTERRLVKLKAYQLVSMRSYASSVLLSKLMERGYARSVCLDVVDELKALGYVQDEEFAKGLVLREFAKGYGPRYIEMKLKSIGLSSDLVAQLITPSMQRKKMMDLKNKWGEKAQIQKFIRRGFDLQIAIEILSK